VRRGCRIIWSHPGGDEEIREEPQFGGISIGVLSKHASSLRLPMKSPITQTAVPHPLNAEKSYDVAQLVEALCYKSEVRIRFPWSIPGAERSKARVCGR
jgi:hypothetical protein